MLLFLPVYLDMCDIVALAKESLAKHEVERVILPGYHGLNVVPRDESFAARRVMMSLSEGTSEALMRPVSTTSSFLLVLFQEQKPALIFISQSFLVYPQTHAAPSNSSDQSTADEHLPLPSMMASSLSSLVTHPCLLVEMAYLMGCAHSLHHWSSLCTAQRRGLTASAAAEGSVLSRFAKGQTALTTSYVRFPEKSVVSPVKNLLTLSGLWTTTLECVTGKETVTTPLSADVSTIRTSSSPRFLGRFTGGRRQWKQ